MGYHLKSVLGVSSNDQHEYFIYHIPQGGLGSRSLKFDWVDEWIGQKFSSIASLIGPKGVIVSAVAGHEGEYSTSFMELNEQVRKHTDYLMTFSGSIQCGPTLIFTRSPLGQRSEGSSVLLNLRYCRDEKVLAEVFDVLIEVIRTGDWTRTEALPDLKGDQNLDRLDYLEDKIDYVILKPNIFGLGIDLNRAFRRASDGIRRYLERQRGK